MNEKIKPLIGLLGGAFDPIHNGHLYIAEQTIEQLGLDEVQFIPCHISAYHKHSTASPTERLRMIELAIQNNPKFLVNDIELKRPGISYTIDTLKVLKNPNSILCFIIGADGLLQFNQWHEWRNIINYCHLIFVNRPNCSITLNTEIKKFHQQHCTTEISQLQKNQAGFIYHLDIKPCDISSSNVRDSLQKNNDSQQIPESVKAYIKANHLYPTLP